ncbi:MAG: transposase [Hydrococcus sp. RM1_1_31]|nr:transposase [Hydrococcus sp. RM1_1_31]
MQVAWKFKLLPNSTQSKTLTLWQQRIRAIVNVCLADRIDSYNQTFVLGEFCDLRSQGIATPLTCSVNKSASLGCPWKINNSELRRGTGAFNPRRSAYEMHSSLSTQWRSDKPWYKEVSADVLQQAIRNLDKAFQNFFSGKTKFPRFKRTNDINIEFKPGTVRIKENRIVFPVLGAMRFFVSRSITENFVVRTVTISSQADGWYVSVLLRDETIPDFPIKSENELQTVVAVDVGVRKIATLSNGETIPNPKIYRQLERRLKIRQRRLSRTKSRSQNRAKQINRVSRTHQQIRRQREDLQWKIAKKIATTADVIAFEALNIKGMKARCKPKRDPVTGKYLRNNQSSKSQLNKAISDAAWHSLKLKTTHQAAKLGNWVIDVNPRCSSQECHQCGYVSPKSRNGEKFICEACSYYEDADVNAAKNLAVRAQNQLGIATLRVVSPKVTPKPELTGEAAARSLNSFKENGGYKETSLTLVGEPGNLVSVKYVQLSLFSLTQEWETG